jgi:hypothetical protein
MTHPEDDEHDIADHGTVIMDRKATSGIARSAANQLRSRPPPIAAGQPAAAPQAAPAGLPMLPPSISGVAPGRAAASLQNKRLAALVAFGSFTVVFVLGALIMILIRLARDSADESPRTNNAVQSKPATAGSGASRSPAK